MRNVLVIAWYDIKRVLRERESLFWLFIGPVIFTVFFGLLFRAEPARRPVLNLINKDATDQIIRDISPLLEADGVSARRAETVNPDRLTLIVPAGALTAIREGKAVEFVLRAGAEETTSERNVRFKFQKAATRLYFSIDRKPAPADSTEAGPLFIREADIGVKKQEMTTGFQRSVPSYLVMFVFLNLLVSGAGVAEDRASGRLRRMAMAPVSRRDIVLGKLLGRFAIGWIQIVYMLAFGAIVGIKWADHPWVFFAFLSIFALAAASMGILLGTLFKDPDKCAGIAVWTAILLSPLGGLWWPIELVGPVMRQIAYVVPTGWAMEGVNSMLAFGAGAMDVAPFAFGFLVLFAVTFPLAARRLQV